MVFQTYALYPAHDGARQHEPSRSRSRRRRKEEIDEAVAKAARILQLEPYLDRLPKALSGGQRQRVAIGRSIVRDPKVYLFDEPLSNLDAALRVATRIEIAQLKESMPDSTMIYVTHDQVEAMTLATRIVVLANKGIAQVGTPLELYERPNGRVRGPVHRLAGDEPAAGRGGRNRAAHAGQARRVAASPNPISDQRRRQGAQGQRRRPARGFQRGRAGRRSHLRRPGRASSRRWAR